VTSEAIAAVEVIVKENRTVTVNEIATHMDKSNGSAHHIVHDILQFHKVSARWVPCQLTAELKELLKRFEAGDGFLGRTFTGDETWVHCHQPKSRRKASEEWRHTFSPKPKKFRSQPSAGKVVLALFWDKRGVILEHYIPRRNPVTSTTYADLLKNRLRPASSPNVVDV
jgi:hypothetical protein